MTRYYFDIRDPDSLVEDDEGMEFIILADAIREAKKALLEMAADAPDADHSTVIIEIREGDEVIVSVVANTATVESSRRARPLRRP